MLSNCPVRQTLVNEGVRRPVRATRPVRAFRARRIVLSIAAAFAATQLVACASKPKESLHHFAAQTGNINPPVIISGNPQRDAVAYQQGNEQLSESDWRELEKLGPRPIWEQLTNKTRTGKPKDADAKGGASAMAAAEHPGRNGAARRARCKKPGASAQTAAAEVSTASTASPTTQPTTRPAPLIELTMNEEDLPFQEIDLPDNKIRIIWTLRSYGGSSVKSTKVDGNTSRRTVDVQAPDLEPLIKVITPALGTGGTVLSLPKENTLVINCDRNMRLSVLDLLSRLDVPQRQVEITAKIFEVSQDFDFQQGANLVLNRLAADGAQQAVSAFSARRFLDAMTGGAPVQGSVLRLMQTFADAGISVDVSFQLLAESGLIKVVSEPRMTVAVGQTGYLLAGQELPIQSVNVANNVVTTSTTYKPVGVQLYITPQAAGDDQVKLHTISVVSSVSGFSVLPSMDNSNQTRTLINPIIDSREAETQVVVGNGDTLVISGLRMVRTATRENKVPGLGDIPVLGWAFKNHRSQQQMTDLYFFVTPVLLDTSPIAAAY